MLGIVLGCLITGMTLYGSESRDLVKDTESESDPPDGLTKTSMFSWDTDAMAEEEREKLLKIMELCGANALYQVFSSDQDPEEQRQFLEDMDEHKIDVYYLTGDASWGLEGSQKRVKKEIDRAVRIRERNHGNAIKGIVLDIEPYLTEEWDDDNETVMHNYVDIMIEVYAYARKKGLPVIICIPYFYDSKDLEWELERLISGACDAVAVMNYNKADEYHQIFTEALLARAYGKAIIHITELQRPGVHQLEEGNTYYEDGLEAVHASWDRLKDQINYERLGFSYHYLAPAIKLYLESGGNHE